MINRVVPVILFSILLLIAGCKKDSNNSSQYKDSPVIILKGDNPQDWQLNQAPYIDPGDSAYDKIDGDLTKDIVITGTVNVAIEGTYTRYYNVKNKGGLSAAQKTRIVKVKPFK